MPHYNGIDLNNTQKVEWLPGGISPIEKSIVLKIIILGLKEKLIVKVFFQMLIKSKKNKFE